MGVTKRHHLGCQLKARHKQISWRNVQKERLEELWPRGVSSLLLRLSADEPAYDSPIFDTGVTDVLQATAAEHPVYMCDMPCS